MTGRAIGLYLVLLCLAGCEVHKRPPGAIQVSNLPAGTTASVLLIGVTGEKCERNLILKTNGSGSVSFGNLVDERCWTCSGGGADRPRIAVFSRGRAAAYLTPQQVCGSSASVNVALGERRKVEVDVWVRSTELLTLAKDEVVNADWVLDRNLTGLALAVRKIEVLPASEAMPEGCKEANSQTTASQFFDPKVLNVYYGIGDNSSCKQPVIFINESGQLLGDLAHEVGHALGLKKSDHENVYPQGHTNDAKGKSVAGFDCNNTMWRNSLILDHSLSLGQSFWMNFSESSFATSAALRLPCADQPGAPSPCVPISTGSVLDEGQACKPCTLESDPTAPRHCTPAEAENILSDRYWELSGHAGKYGLTMGSVSPEEMNEHWRARTAIAIVAAPVSDAIAGAKSDEERQHYLAYLQKAVARYGSGLYAEYSYVSKLVQDGKYSRLGCVSE